MATVTPYSYEHPRRTRPFLISNDNKRNLHASEDFAVYGSRFSHVEESIERLETNLNEKMNTLFSRMDKCSDLAVASSRAIAALSNQFEDLRLEVERKLSTSTSAADEVRSSMNKLCSESQNLTMTALEDCCNQLVKQIKNNSDNVIKCNESIMAIHASTASALHSTESELKTIKASVTELSSEVVTTRQFTQALEEDMRVVAEECVNAGLEELNAKFTRDLESFDFDWKGYRENIDHRFHQFDKRLGNMDQQTSGRHEELKKMFDERMRSEIDAHVKETLIPQALAKSKREFTAEVDDLRNLVHALPKVPELPEASLRNISADVCNVQSIMASFTATTIPTLYREVELKVAHCEHHAQQQCLDLLKEFATEMEFDIDRMVELIHSVFVQARIPMPPGTSSSWKRFREVMFDKETIGGIRVRRPILGETPRSRTRTGRF